MSGGALKTQLYLFGLLTSIPLEQVLRSTASLCVSCFKTTCIRRQFLTENFQTLYLMSSVLTPTFGRTYQRPSKIGYTINTFKKAVLVIQKVSHLYVLRKLAFHFFRCAPLQNQSKKIYQKTAEDTERNLL